MALKTALNLMDALQDRIHSDIQAIEKQFLDETKNQEFPFLKGRKYQCRLVLEYIEALRKVGTVYDQESSQK